MRKHLSLLCCLVVLFLVSATSQAQNKKQDLKNANIANQQTAPARQQPPAPNPSPVQFTIVDGKRVAAEGQGAKKAIAPAQKDNSIQGRIAKVQAAIESGVYKNDPETLKKLNDMIVQLQQQKATQASFKTYPRKSDDTSGDSFLSVKNPETGKRETIMISANEKAKLVQQFGKPESNPNAYINVIKKAQ